MKIIARAAVAVSFSLGLAACGENITIGATSRGAMNVGDTVTGSINGSTGVTTIPGRSSSIDVPAETWTVSLTNGQVVTLLMCRTSGTSFDPYVSIHGPGGRGDNVRVNDDGASSLNSRLVYTATSTGTGNATMVTGTAASATAGPASGGAVEGAVGSGAVGTEVLTCDFSYDYVKINASYRS